MLHYLEIGFLAILLLIGSPLSLYSLYKLWWSSGRPVTSRTNRSRSQISRDFLWLQRSLNISDIIVVHVYVLQQLIKKSFGRAWFGGFILCKFVHIASTFGFHLSSNTIASIAIDRLVCAVVLNKIIIRNTVSPRISALLCLSVLIALAVSIPQCLVWGTAERPLRKSSNSTSREIVCTTVWQLNSNSNSSYHWVHTYMHIHSLTLSPIPTTIILVCYAIMGIVIKRKMRFSTNLNPSITEKREDSDYSQLDPTSRAKPSIEGKRWRQSRMIVIVSLAIVIAYVICWLPYNISTLWSEVDELSYLRFRPSFSFTWHMIAINAILNPIIYRMTLGSSRS